MSTPIYKISDRAPKFPCWAWHPNLGWRGFRTVIPDYTDNNIRHWGFTHWCHSETPPTVTPGEEVLNQLAEETERLGLYDALPPASDVQRVAEEICAATLPTSMIKSRWWQMHGASIASILTRFAAELTATKDAEIARLNAALSQIDKLASTDLEEETATLRRAEKAEAELAAEKDYVETQHIACWNRIIAALGGDSRPRNDDKSLCDEVVEAIAERDKLSRFYDEIVAKLGHDRVLSAYDERGELLRQEAQRRKEAEAELRTAQDTVLELTGKKDRAEAELAEAKKWSDAKTKLGDDLLCEVRELRAYRERMEWLHRGNDKDAEGFEWGVFRVKWDAQGQPVSVLHTLTDLTDLDAAMGASRMPRYYDEIADLQAQLIKEQDYSLELKAERDQLRAEVERLNNTDMLVKELREQTQYVRELCAEVQAKQHAIDAAAAHIAQLSADVERLSKVVLLDGDTIDALSAQLAAAQEALREIAAAAAPLVEIGIPAYGSQDDCRYQVPFYDCPDDLVLYQDGMGGSITVGAVRALRAAVAAARAKEDKQ